MDCLFCKIINGDIPCSKVYEDETVLAFRDIEPQAPTHILIIPKEHIKSAAEITCENSAVIAHIFEVAAKIAKDEGIAESGYRMKNSVITAFPESHLRNETQTQKKRSDSFDQQRSLYDHLCQPDNARKLQRIDALLNHAALPQADPSSDINRKKYADRHKSESARLYQQKNDDLSKQRPVTESIRYDQPGHAGRTRRRKQSLQKTCTLSPRRSRQHEKKRSRHNNDQKSNGYRLNLRQPASFSFFHFLFRFRFFILYRICAPYTSPIDSNIP